MSTLHAIYASTSGHTEYAVSLVADVLKENKIDVSVQKAEAAGEADLQQGDVLLLAASSWNTGGKEGQLNPHMFMYLLKKCKKADLAGKKVLIIGTGDHRYRYTCMAADHLEEWVDAHGGQCIGETLRVIDEPYHQEQEIRKWAEDLLPLLS